MHYLDCDMWDCLELLSAEYGGMLRGVVMQNDAPGCLYGFARVVDGLDPWNGAVPTPTIAALRTLVTPQGFDDAHRIVCRREHWPPEARIPFALAMAELDIHRGPED